MVWSGAEPVLVSHGCPTNRNFSAFMQVEGFCVDSPHLHYEHTELIPLRKTRVLRKGARKI